MQTIVWVGGLFVLLLVIGVGFYFSNVIIKPKTHEVQKTYEIESNAGKLVPEVYESLEKEEVTITSPYGYPLFGIFFPIEGAKKTVILCHGITYTLYGSVKYIDIFRKNHCNVLIYDHRNHGRSGGKNTTFGYYEKYDLKAWTDWILNHRVPNSKVGIHGESMGAAVALQNAALDTRVSFYIADCPFSDLQSQLQYRLKIEYHLPSFPFIYIANIMTKLRVGAFFSDISPITHMHQIDTPIFFIHGQEDRYIPSQMTVDLYTAKKGTKKIYLAPTAGHAESYWKNQQTYTHLVKEFLESIHF